MKKKNGFTLIELLAVIVIMGILMLVAIPAISRVIENSRKDTFVDIAKSYVNAARNLWTTDNLTCEGRISSAVDDGDYYILINTKDTAKDHLPVLLDQGGKSSWGNRDVNGYVRVNVSTTTGTVDTADADGDGNTTEWLVEPKRTTKFYVGLTDGTHGLIDDNTKVSDNLVRGDVNMDLSTEQLMKTKLTTDAGKLNCSKTNLGSYVCYDVTPGTNITGLCTDDKTASDAVDQIEITPVNFTSDDWLTVVASLKAGIHPYQVGDTKTIDMGSFGTHTIRIANLTPCDGSLESQSACGVVLEYADIITRGKMNSTNTNVGGWTASEMRTYLNNDIYNALPAELQSAIIDTKVVSGHGSTSGETNFTSTDKLYLLSTAEVWKNGTSNKINYDSARESTRQLDYYKNLGVTTRNYSRAKKQYNGSNYYWWLRAANSPDATGFFRVNSYGNWKSYDANFPYGVSPAFRIA